MSLFLQFSTLNMEADITDRYLDHGSRMMCRASGDNSALVHSGCGNLQSLSHHPLCLSAFCSSLCQRACANAPKAFSGLGRWLGTYPAASLIYRVGQDHQGPTCSVAVLRTADTHGPTGIPFSCVALQQWVSSIPHSLRSDRQVSDPSVSNKSTWDSDCERCRWPAVPHHGRTVHR